MRFVRETTPGDNDKDENVVEKGFGNYG